MSHEAIYHLGRAVGLVNEQLSTPKALSSSTLIVVNFLVVHEIVRESKSEAEIHLKGLQKMVHMRGGLANLETSEDALLVLKFCRYVALMHSIGGSLATHHLWLIGPISTVL